MGWASWEQFLGAALQSLGAQCHARKRTEERLGYRCDFDENGLPRDARHPAWEAKRPMNDLRVGGATKNRRCKYFLRGGDRKNT